MGEAGVGKSRLVYELTHSHHLQRWLTLESASVSYGKATSYLPVIDLLKVYFNILERDHTREIRDKVTGKVLTLDKGLKPTLPALLALLDVPVDDTAWEALDPAQRRQRTLDAVVQLLLREAREQALLLVIEDLHWIDGETQALLDGLVDSLGSARLLLFVNYRPEYQHGWGGKSSYNQLRLDALPAESAGELLDALLGEDPGLAPLKRLLVKRGNPFFLEETVRTLVETHALAGERGRYQLTKPVEAIKVPPTVQAMLAARIDRLPTEEKRLLQVASVIGKDVPFALLAAIADRPEEALRRGLSQLQKAEFLYETQLFPNLEYTFKHALTHDVAYAGLLAERRRALHAAVVSAIEHSIRRSPRRARRKVGASRAARRGLGQGRALPAPGRYESLPALGQPRSGHLLRAGARCAPQAAGDRRHDRQVHRPPLRPPQCARPTRRVCTDRGRSRRGRSPRGVGRRPAATRPRTDLPGTSVLVRRRLRGRAPSRPSRPGHRRIAGRGQVVANLYLGRTYMARGECSEAVRHCEAVIALMPESLAQERFGQAAIPSSFAGNTLATALGALGRFAEAFVRIGETFHIAEKAGHIYSLLYPIFGFGILKLDQGDFVGAIGPLERGFELCRTREVPVLLQDFTWALGAAYYGTGRRAEGVSLMEEAVGSPS